jgi:hypothetical protein
MAGLETFISVLVLLCVPCSRWQCVQNCGHVIPMSYLKPVEVSVEILSMLRSAEDLRMRTER